MAEPAKPKPRVAVVAPEADALAAINDHLGRFLRQADELLDEWTRFGGEVRARVDGEVDRVGGAVAQAVDGAVDRVAGRAAERVAEEVAGRLVTRLHDVGAELDRVTRAARRASAAAAEIQGERHRASRVALGALAAALIADVLLAVLLLRSPPTSEPAPSPGVAAACRELSRGWSEAAFTVVRAAGVEACGDLEATVDGVILARLAPPPQPEPEPEDTQRHMEPEPAAGTGTGSGSVAPKPAKQRKAP